MLQGEVIVPVNTERTIATVFAPKEDISLTFNVDYRKRKVLIVRDSDLLPRMDVHIDSLGKAKISSTPNRNSAYWQTAIDERNRLKTALANHHGLFQFVPIPFGLKNVQMIFQ